MAEEEKPGDLSKKVEEEEPKFLSAFPSLSEIKTKLKGEKPDYVVCVADAGSTRTRATILAVKFEANKEGGHDTKILYRSKPIAVSSEVGIVPKGDIAAKMAVEGAESLKKTYKSLTLRGDDLDQFREIINVSFPEKLEQPGEHSMTALERLLNDETTPLVDKKEGESETEIPVYLVLSVPRMFANQYKEVIEEQIMPRVIGRNGRNDNAKLIAAEAFFEARAIRDKAAQLKVDDEKVNLGGKFGIISVGGSTTNIYIADGKQPTEKNSTVIPYAGRAVIDDCLGKVLSQNTDARLDESKMEELLFEDTGNGVRAVLCGFSEADVQTPIIKANIPVRGTESRERNIGDAVEGSVRGLFKKTYSELVGLLNRYKAQKLPGTFVCTGRAGQIPGFAEALEEGLHKGGYADVHVYRSTDFKDKKGESLFDPELTVVEGGLSTFMFAEADPDYTREFIAATQ